MYAYDGVQTSDHFKNLVYIYIELITRNNKGDVLEFLKFLFKFSKILIFTEIIVVYVIKYF